MDETKDNDLFSWESKITSSWDALKKNDTLIYKDEFLPQPKSSWLIKRNGRPSKIIRHLVLIVDDISIFKQMGSTFLRKYYELNPLGQISIVLLYDRGLAKCVYGGTKPSARQLDKLYDNLRKFTDSIEDSFFSLSNGIRCALGILEFAGQNSSKEILLIHHLLSSVDSEPIPDIPHGYVFSSISFSAKMHLVSKLCVKTNGQYFIAADSYSNVWEKFVSPPSEKLNVKVSDLLKMSFPIQMKNSTDWCICHPFEKRQRRDLYKCPICSNIVCNIPCECPVCSHILLSAVDLSRSYHHLFPVPSATKLNKSAICRCCNENNSTSLYACSSCTSSMCIGCLNFIHEILFNCPFCIK